MAARRRVRAAARDAARRQAALLQQALEVRRQAKRLWRGLVPVWSGAVPAWLPPVPDPLFWALQSIAALLDPERWCAADPNLWRCSARRPGWATGTIVARPGRHGCWSVRLDAVPLGVSAPEAHVVAAYVADALVEHFGGVSRAPVPPAPDLVEVLATGPRALREWAVRSLGRGHAAGLSIGASAPSEVRLPAVSPT